MNQILINFIFNSPRLEMRQWKYIGRVVVRYVLAICMTLTAMSGHAQASGLTCEDLFSDTVSYSDEILPLNDERFAKVYKEEYAAIEKWWERAAVKVMRARIKSKVVEICQQGCSEKDISRIVAESIDVAFLKIDKGIHNAKRIRGLAILTGITVGSLVGGSYLKMSLPGDEKFLTVLTTVVVSTSAVVLFKLASPLLDQVQAIANRGAYRLIDGKEFFRKNVEFVRMRALYRILREKMTPLEQEEATRVSALLGQLAPTFGTAIESFESADKSKGGMPAAAARIADIAIRMRQYFPEIRSDDPEVIRTIDMVFTQRVVIADPENPGNFIPDRKRLEALYELTVKQIEKYDPLYRESPDAAELYRNSIRAWLGLN